MIHSGSVIAAGISQGRSTSLKRDFKVRAPSRCGPPRCAQDHGLARSRARGAWGLGGGQGGSCDE